MVTMCFTILSELLEMKPRGKNFTSTARACPHSARRGGVQTPACGRGKVDEGGKQGSTGVRSHLLGLVQHGDAAGRVPGCVQQVHIGAAAGQLPGALPRQLHLALAASSRRNP